MQLEEAKSVELVLPDGAVRTFAAGVTGLEVLRAVRDGHGPQGVPGAAADGADPSPVAVAVRVGERVLDLGRPILEGGTFRPLTLADPEGLEVYRHTATHVMAQAVRRLYPETKLAVGPVIADGFYYDMDVRDAQGNPVRVSEDELPRIEEEMRRIVAADYPVVREVWEREQARAYFAERGEVYKVEIIDGLPPEAEVSVYRQGEFVDLCRGPHLPSTGLLRAFRLLAVAGAYWRGDERRPMLQRIYGTAFARQEELDRFLWVREEAKRRDHRRLGPELGLFFFAEESPGFPVWLPRGYTLYRELENFSRQLQARRGYQEVRTPVIFRSTLYERSGHWAHFRDNMFDFEKDGEWYAVKPMNCPAHCLVYKQQLRSYRDLPLRLAEYGQLVRYERSGTLHGLLRVRSLHQDDAHLFVREDQIQEEIADVLGLIDEVYGTFGMAYEVFLSTRPEKAMGDPALWERAEAALAGALEAAGRPYRVNPGDGAFYGPKLDFYVTDALDRRWQCATVQLDFQFPERFDLTYVAPDGSERRPVMIHRAIMGTLERFIGVLTEHFAGAFPTWLAPVQVRVLPVTSRVLPYARQVAARLAERGIRAEVDEGGDKVGAQVRRAQLEKIPYMLVVGDREAAQGTVSVRSRRSGDLGTQGLEAFAADLRTEIATRRLEPR
jgi:threonyl-tRNA synthetase